MEPEPAAVVVPPLTARKWSGSARAVFWFGVVLAAAIVLAVLIWQGFAASGNPDPATPGLGPVAVVMNTGILVFREGLEAVLVLAALTASLTRTEGGFWKPVALGACLSFLASVATWFIVVAILATISSDTSVSALDIQAATGALAILVLLVIMNWFFHKVYWRGWITHHDRRKRELIESPHRGRSAVFRGLVLLGFTAVYREGFEVVLFLQSLRLKAGTPVVLKGVLIGLGLTLIVGFLTFVAHYRLPYRKMLIFTGIMLGMVLMVMVGEQVQEMQQANWMGTTGILPKMPDWLGTWFAIFPNVQGLVAQALAVGVVAGSYFLAKWFQRRPAAPAQS